MAKSQAQRPGNDYNDSNPLIHDLMITGYIRGIIHDQKQNLALDVIRLIATFASLIDCWDLINSNQKFNIDDSQSYLQLRSKSGKLAVAFGLMTVEKGQKVEWHIKLLKGASNIIIGIIPTQYIAQFAKKKSLDLFNSSLNGVIGFDVGFGYLYSKHNQFFQCGWENDIISMELDMSKDVKKWNDSGKNKTTKKCTLRYCINNSSEFIITKVNGNMKYKLAVSMKGNKHAIKIVDDSCLINQTSEAVW